MNTLKIILCLASALLFTACNKEKSHQKTGLPVVYIKTENGNDILSKTDFLKARILIISEEGKTLYANSTQIKGRGNYSWFFSPKKGYRIKLDEKAGLFGMHDAKNWILVANYSDPTNLFNTVALELGNRLQMDFCNHTQHVELVINGKHLGNYLLTEKIETKKGRVEVNTKKGGFLAELDTHLDEKYSGSSKHYNLPLMIHSPEKEAAFKRAMFLINKIDSAISNNNFTYKDYAPYVDVESLAKYLLHSELICNLEWMHPKSIYVYSYDEYDKLHFGMPWDYDWAFGDARYFDPDRSYSYFENPTFQSMGKSVIKPCLEGENAGFHFFNRFFQDSEFCRIYRKTWRTYYKDIRSIDSYIDQMFKKMSVSNKLDAEKWLPFKYNEDSLSTCFQNYMRTRIDAIDKRINSY
ncbi:MAG: CotH kinase family protein [Paludibacteraceae bacterium]|nr:CotH kinase family protein [Paludibacteraceae bacterium]